MESYWKVSILFLALVFTGLSTEQFSLLLSKLVPIIIFGGSIGAYIYRDRLRDVYSSMSSNISDFYFRIQGIIKKQDSRILNFLFRKPVLIGLLVVSIFAFHFWLQWMFGRRVVLSGVIHIVVDPFYFLLQKGIPEAFAQRHFQINSYTGNPFFLLPFLFLTGYSPLGLRVVLIGVFALTATFCFLAYYEALDLKKAVLGTLILTSMSKWVFYRWADYDYTILFFVILLFLYFRWLNVDLLPRSRYVYLLSFVSGLFFYFKATVAYMVVSIGVAGLYYKRDNLLEFFKGLDYPKIIVLFLIGVSPFFAYNAFNTETLVKDGFSFAGPEDTNLVSVPVERFNQLDYWMHSEVERVTTLPALSSLSLVSSLNPFRNLHLTSVLLLLSIPFLALIRKHVQIAILFSVFYVLMFFIPIRSGVWKYQLTVLVPLVPLVLMSVLDAIPNRIEQTIGYKTAFSFVCLLFLLGTAMNVSELQNDSRPDASSFDVNYWAGDQVFYDDFDRLDISQPVLTNSYKVHVITKYFLDIPGSDFLLPPNISKKDLDEHKRKFALVQYYSVSPDMWDKGGVHREIEGGEQFAVVLKQNDSCDEADKLCGASTQSVINEFDLNKKNMERVTLDNNSYLVARNASLAP